MNLLKKIVEHKREEVQRQRKAVSMEFLKSHAATRATPPDFNSALRTAPMGLIAEIKRKSPSAGEIRPDLRAEHLAEQYAAAGAQAISILIDQTYFGGEESDFVMVRDTIEVPILYKEFVTCCWQIWHAASIGASAVLIIVAALTDRELERLIRCAATARMTPLVEVHTPAEMKRAARFGAPCIGINNRDLTTFEVSLDTTFQLLDHVPSGATVISESGIRRAEDVLKLKEAGVHGVLVGEHLLRQADVGAAIKELMGSAWASS